MNFNSAYKEMLNGKRIRRAEWVYNCDGKSYQYCFIDNHKIKIKLKNNAIITDTTSDILFEAEKIDWEVLDKIEINQWKPKKNKKYWYVDTDFTVSKAYNKYMLIKNSRIDAGNCFKTFYEADRIAKKLKVIKQLQDFASAAGDINWENIEQHKYYIDYDYNSRKVEISHSILFVCTRVLPFNIYFTSYEAAKKAIEFVGEEKIRRYYFDIDEENTK